jgi:hypothetical protein
MTLAATNDFGSVSELLPPRRVIFDETEILGARRVPAELANRKREIPAPLRIRDATSPGMREGKRDREELECRHPARCDGTAVLQE